MYFIHRLVVVLLIAVFFDPTAAQEATPEPLVAATEQFNKERRQLIEDNLELTDAEAKGFWPIYYKLEDDMAKLQENRTRIIAEFGQNYDQMTDTVAKKLLTERLDLEEKQAKLWKIYFKKFQKVLPTKKLARYYQIEHKIRAFVDAGIAEEIPLIK